MSSLSNQRGFTVIELVIVIAILTVLAAIAIPAYQDYLGKMQAAEGYSLLTAYKGPVSELVTSDANVVAGCSKSVPSLSELPVDNKVVSAVELSADGGVCRVTATFKTADMSLAMNPKVAGKTLTIAYSPSTKAWVCTTNMPDVTKPMDCETPAKVQDSEVTPQE
jgi:type IV pilus assembly protein PilA